MDKNETQLKQMVTEVSRQLAESKKNLAELKNKLQQEETTVIGLKIKLESLQRQLKEHLAAHEDTSEMDAKNSKIDSEFRDRLSSLLEKIS